MKRHQGEMSDSPTCKQQKTAKEEEVPNSLLSLPKEILQYCIFSFFFSTAFHLLDRDTIDLCLASVNESTKSMQMKMKT
jgi:hypothetical protein